ncbi:hypothetical protein C1H46_000338 [Malus baccata]|uniref:Uncharacterized protein n=1 Tax=Malus baccata TaxID=106549 RepID=A0A540NSM7_MALBA|nr:hypothetical protein C1H46_000338 [Malus baccata]
MEGMTEPAQSIAIWLKGESRERSLILQGRSWDRVFVECQVGSGKTEIPKVFGNGGMNMEGGNQVIAGSKVEGIVNRGYLRVGYVFVLG